jgi:hypothetical protein
MLGPKKQDFWPKINVLKEKKNPSMNDGLSKIGHDFRIENRH